MDIDDGGVDGFMTKERFDGEQVGAVFIKVGAKSMAPGMGGNAVLPAEPCFMLSHMAHDIIGRIRLGGVAPGGKEPASRASIGVPVSGKNVQRVF